jgi:sigma-E factor negative regulatory protein RseB
VRAAVLPACFLLAASSGAAGADPFPQDGLNWLQTMAFAAHQTDYSGVFVYRYGNHVENSRITHIADKNGEHGRLESLDGTQREVIRNNDQTWCFVNGRKVEMADRQSGRDFPALLPEQLALLNQNYIIKPAEEGRLAGLHAHALIIKPHDKLRYTHKMWADSASGLLLKSEVLDEHNNVIEEYSFTELSIGKNVDRSWLAQEKQAAVSSIKPQHTAELRDEKIPHVAQAAQAKEPPYASGWRVDAIPAGFKKIAEVQRRLHDREMPVTQIVYSDGLAGISVFIEQSDNDEDDKSGLSNQGLIQIYTRLADNYLITVVGEVPAKTVMQVGDSVRRGGI